MHIGHTPTKMVLQQQNIHMQNNNGCDNNNNLDLKLIYYRRQKHQNGSQLKY